MNLIFTIESAMILALIFVVYVAAMTYLSQVRGKSLGTQDYIVLTSFVLYLLTVTHFVIFPIDVNIGDYASQSPWYASINYIPVLTVDLSSFVLNMILMMPFGVLLPLLSTRYASAKQVAGRAFMVSLSIELLQWLITVTLGSARISDINDLIANTLGALIGYVALKQLSRLGPIQHLREKLTLQAA